MEMIVLKPKPLRFSIWMFLAVFISFSILKYGLFGWYSDPDIWLFFRARIIEGLVATVTYLLVSSILCPWKNLRIILGGTTIQAPVKKGVRLKPVVIELSDISISRTFKDWLNGTQLVTREGEVLRIGPLFYAPKAVPHLLDEIEKRQKK